MAAVLLLLFLSCLPNLGLNHSVHETPSYAILEKIFGGNISYKITRNILPIPQQNLSSPVVVTLHLSLHQILGVDEKNEVVTLNFWVRANWTNPFLKWDPEKFSGLKTLVVETEKLWTPDITLWNRAVEQNSLYERMEKRIRIHHDGLCTWKSLVTTTSSCIIDVKNFPFDKQTCELQFGSWHYPSHELSFRLENQTCIELSYFSGSREWTIKETSSELTREWFNRDGYFDVVHCRLTVDRNALFYIVNMIVPCAIICLLGCLTFVLPPSSGERVSVVMTVLLATTVYMLIIAEFMPAAANEIASVQKYQLFCIVGTALCLIATCIVVRWHETTGSMPRWIYVIFNCIIPKILFVRHDGNCRSQVTEEAQGLALTYTLDSDTPKLEIKEQERDWKLAAKSLNKFFLIFFTVCFCVLSVVLFKQV